MNWKRDFYWPMWKFQEKKGNLPFPLVSSVHLSSMLNNQQLYPFWSVFRSMKSLWRRLALLELILYYRNSGLLRVLVFWQSERLTCGVTSSSSVCRGPSWGVGCGFSVSKDWVEVSFSHSVSQYPISPLTFHPRCRNPSVSVPQRCGQCFMHWRKSQTSPRPLS